MNHSKGGEAKITDLPDDLLIRIFQRHVPDGRILARLDQTCRHFYQLTERAGLWKQALSARFRTSSIPTSSYRHAYLDLHVAQRLQHGAPVLRHFVGHEDEVVGCSLLDELAATCSRDGTARIWQTNRGRALFQLDCHEPVNHVQLLSADSNGPLALTASGRTCRLWKGLTIQRSFTDYASAISAAKVLDQSLVTLERGGNVVRVMNLYTGQAQHLIRFPCQVRCIDVIEVSGGRSLIIAGGHDGSISLFDTGEGRIVHSSKWSNHPEEAPLAAQQPTHSDDMPPPLPSNNHPIQTFSQSAISSVDSRLNNYNNIVDSSPQVSSAPQPRSSVNTPCSLESISMHSRDPRYLVGFMQPRHHSSTQPFIACGWDLRMTPRLVWERPLDHRFHDDRTLVPHATMPELGADAGIMVGSEAVFELFSVSTGVCKRHVAIPREERAAVHQVECHGGTILAAIGKRGGLIRF